jgi:hypothetical protein
MNRTSRLGLSHAAAKTIGSCHNEFNKYSATTTPRRSSFVSFFVQPFAQPCNLRSIDLPAFDQAHYQLLARSAKHPIHQVAHRVVQGPRLCHGRAVLVRSPPADCASACLFFRMHKPRIEIGDQSVEKFCNSQMSCTLERHSISFHSSPENVYPCHCIRPRDAPSSNPPPSPPPPSLSAAPGSSPRRRRPRRVSTYFPTSPSAPSPLKYIVISSSTSAGLSTTASGSAKVPRLPMSTVSARPSSTRCAP